MCIVVVNFSALQLFLAYNLRKPLKISKFTLDYIACAIYCCIVIHKWQYIDTSNLCIVTSLVHIYVHIHKYLHPYVSTYTHAQMHTPIHTYIKYIHTYLYYTYTYRDNFMHTFSCFNVSLTSSALASALTPSEKKRLLLHKAS